MAELKIATKAFCNTLKSGSFTGDTTMCPTRSQIETAGLYIKKGYTYATDQLVPEDHIERLDWEYTFSVTPTTATISAAGGSQKFTVTSYKRQYSYSTAGNRIYVEGSQTNVTYSSSNSGSGTWTSGTDTISYSSNPGGSEKTGTITWTQSESFNGEPKKTATATHKQNADTISSYDNPIVDTFSYPVIPAAGGTVSPNYTWHQTIHWVSGRTTTNTTNGTAFFVGNSINPSTGQVTANSKGTTSSSETTVSNVTLTITANGKSGSKSTECKQGANSYSDSWGTWSVGISANPTTISAAGGTSTLSGTASRSGTRTWTSGSTQPLNSGDQSVTSFSIVSAFTGFSLSGSTLTAVANSNTSTRSVQVRGTYSGVNSSAVTITQSGDSVASWSDISISISSVSDIPASGGSVTISASATQAYTMVSGATGSQAVSVSYSPSQTVSAGSKGTTASGRTSVQTVTVSASANGKSASDSITVYQAANSYSDGSYGSWETPSISANPTTIAGSGGSSTISYTSSISRSYVRSWSSGSTQNLSQSSSGSISLTTNPGNAFSLSGTTLSVGNNTSGGERSAVVTGSWSTAGITKTVTVKQEGEKKIVVIVVGEKGYIEKIEI